MQIVSEIFKAYDIRGKVGTELTEEVAEAVGRALADFLDAGPVAVGRDMRPDSGALADAVIRGLVSQGRDVVNIGEVTTDMIYFAVGHGKLAGGAMVTASHNPGEYNGIKLCREEAKPIGQESGLLDIRDAIANGTLKPNAAALGTVTEQDIAEDWIQHALSFIDTNKLKDLHIAVDAGNGMAGKIFPEIEPYVPWEVEEMYFDLDGTFPNHEANPLKFETLSDMIAKIKSMKLDGGVAFDGDGDRAFLVDETGTVLTGNVMNAMLAEYFLGLFPGSAILYDLRSSRVVPETIAAHGGKPIRTRVGHAFIKQILREQNSPFGGEVSGHFYFRDNFYADSGLIAAVIGLYVAGLRGQKLSEIRKSYEKYATLEETNFEVADKTAALERLKSTFSSEKQDELDGLSVEFADGAWFNVRASNTEPVMRLNAEAGSPEALKGLVAKVSALIEGN
jgi:phosphomannomutase